MCERFSNHTDIAKCALRDMLPGSILYARSRDGRSLRGAIRLARNEDMYETSVIPDDQSGDFDNVGIKVGMKSLREVSLLGDFLFISAGVLGAAVSAPAITMMAIGGYTCGKYLFNGFVRRSFFNDFQRSNSDSFTLMGFDDYTFREGFKYTLEGLLSGKVGDPITIDGWIAMMEEKTSKP